MKSSFRIGKMLTYLALFCLLVSVSGISRFQISFSQAHRPAFGLSVKPFEDRVALERILNVRGGSDEYSDTSEEESDEEYEEDFDENDDQDLDEDLDEITEYAEEESDEDDEEQTVTIEAELEFEEDEIVVETEAFDDAVEDEIVADTETFEDAMDVAVEDEQVQEEATVPETESGETPSFTPDDTVEENNGDDSTANVDRMEFADAYDEGESAPETNDNESEPAFKVNAPVDAPLTEDLRRTLIKDLKYRKSEVDSMRYDIAVIVAHKRLMRPMEGVPSKWFVGGVAPKESRVLFVVKRVALPLATAALAISVATITGMSIDFGSRPTKNTKQEDDVDIFSDILSQTEALGETEEIVHYNEHVNKVGEGHAHSLKPGTIDAEDEQDLTGLDKAITTVENVFKGAFRAKI